MVKIIHHPLPCCYCCSKVANAMMLFSRLWVRRASSSAAVFCSVLIAGQHCDTTFLKETWSCECCDVAGLVHRPHGSSQWMALLLQGNFKKKKKQNPQKLNTSEMFGWKFSIENSGCVEMETFHGTDCFAVNF